MNTRMEQTIKGRPPKRHRSSWVRMCALVMAFAGLAACFVTMGAAPPAAAAGPVVSMGSMQVVEGNSPTVVGAAKVPITLSDVQPTDVIVTWMVSGGTATAGADYKAITKPKTTKIKAGKVRGFASLSTYGDSVPEGLESIVITITGVTGAAIGTGTGTIKIADAPPAGPTVSMGGVDVLEGNTALVSAPVKVAFTLSEPAAVDVLVTWSITGGTATPGVDFKAIPNPKTTKIRAGKTVGYATVVLYGDTVYEGTGDTIDIFINSVAGAAGTFALVNILILDDDEPVGQPPTPSNYYAWGAGGAGQLGDGMLSNRPSPARMDFGKPLEWADVTAGSGHTCGVYADGTAWCWGDNSYGQLGTGTMLNEFGPNQVGTATDWRSISAGQVQTCGVRADDSAWCWGRNDVGQLGDGTNVLRSEPVEVLDNGVGWSSVVTGNGLHTCGVKVDATLWCWGSNSLGELGDGTTTGQLAPIQVGGGTSDWMSVAVGSNHTCGVRDTTGSGEFTVWCWGANFFGQVGDGTSTVRHEPTPVANAPTDWSANLSAGTNHTCGVRTNGDLYCWGRNQFGEVGDGTTVPRTTPTHVQPGSHWGAVAAGDGHTCAIADNEALWCWGWNGAGAVGDGTLTDSSVPLLVPGMQPVTHVSTNQHTVALMPSPVE